MPKEAVPEAAEVLEHDRLRAVPATRAAAAVPSDLLGDRLQQSGTGGGGQGLVRKPPAQRVVAQAQQVAESASEARLLAEPRRRILRMRLPRQFKAHLDEALEPLLKLIDETRTVYPDTDLRLVYESNDR